MLLDYHTKRAPYFISKVLFYRSMLIIIRIGRLTQHEFIATLPDSQDRLKGNPFHIFNLLSHCIFKKSIHLYNKCVKISLIASLQDPHIEYLTVQSFA